MSAWDLKTDAGQFRRALAAGSERMAAWADLLDGINVFPVADGDTGRNLVISLHPLKDTRRSEDELIEALLLAARGNSGNIAAQFFQGLLAAWRPDDLPGAVRRGRELAWRAVAEPKPGTMLSLFDVLAEGISNGLPAGTAGLDALLDLLERAVQDTRTQLAELSQAGVVDAGALGMFLFWDGFLNTLHGRPEGFRPVAERFGGCLQVGEDYQARARGGFCVDAVVRSSAAAELLAELGTLGESVVSQSLGDLVKIHLHTADPTGLQARLEARADLLRFAADDLDQQTGGFLQAGQRRAIHVMTDAAGSLTRTDARRLGLSLLDSYVNLGPRSIPETHLEPAELYAAMRAGLSVSTSQASVFERHQHYRKVLSLHPKVLYLCVGSVYTGNHQVVSDWKRQHDPDDRLVVIDSQAASGRLALMALDAAEYALVAEDAAEVVARARRAVAASREWIFLDQLKWLARGGRLSKTSAFVGDLLSMKPVVTPGAQGAEKVAVLRNAQAQVDFACQRLAELRRESEAGRLLLEYTDNRDWLEDRVRPRLAACCPGWSLGLQPVSLTSGVHMGPGTWALAALPRLAPEAGDGGSGR